MIKQKITIILSTVFLSLWSLSALSKTDITDHFYEDTTLLLNESPYAIKQITAVVAGVTLTIEPGVEICFDSGTSLIVEGSVIAEGTSSERIVFKSANSYANTNPGDWEQIYIVSSTSIFDFVDVIGSNFGIYQDLATNPVTNSFFEKNNFSMTFVHGGEPEITNNTIVGNRHGILILGGVDQGIEYQAMPVINNNTIDGQTYGNIYANSTTGDDLSHITINAVNNDWGALSPEEIQEKIIDGLDDGVSPIVDFNTAPTLNPIGNKNADPITLLSFAVSAADSSRDTIILSAENLPSGASFTDNHDGTGTFSWTPGYGQAGSHDINFIATDFYGETDEELVTINVSGGDNQWAERRFACDYGHENSFNLLPSGIPVCGSSNCPGAPGSCWGNSSQTVGGSYGPGSLQINHPKDTQVLAQTWLYTQESLSISVNFSGDVGNIFINGQHIPSSSSAVLNLQAGCNRVEVTSYNQNSSGFATISTAIANLSSVVRQDSESCE